MLLAVGPVPFGLTTWRTSSTTPPPGGGSLGSTQRNVPTLTAVPRR